MRTHLFGAACVPVLVAAVSCAVPSMPTEHASASVVVCPETAAKEECDYIGMVGLQEAVDAAVPGARICLRPGVYIATAYRDVPFQDLNVRGAVVIEDKQLSLIAEPGAVLIGTEEFPVSAIVINKSSVDISGLEISGFTYLEPEDDIYDGHGIFTIASEVSLESVRIVGVDKMAVTGRETGRVTARNLIIEQSHLGVWLEETAALNMTDSRIAGSESAAIAAYGNAVADMIGSVIDGNQDDGLYTEDKARIRSFHSDILNNAPYGARAAGDSRILICAGQISGNSAAIGEENAGRVLRNDPERCDKS